MGRTMIQSLATILWKQAKMFHNKCMYGTWQHPLSDHQNLGNWGSPNLSFSGGSMLLDSLGLAPFGPTFLLLFFCFVLFFHVSFLIQ